MAGNGNGQPVSKAQILEHLSKLTVAELAQVKAAAAEIGPTNAKNLSIVEGAVIHNQEAAKTARLKALLKPEPGEAQGNDLPRIGEALVNLAGTGRRK